MPLPSDKLLFAGPSLTPQSTALAARAGIVLRPPVQRHDLLRLLEEGFTGALILADGVFQQVMAVGHQEIRSVLEAGCPVFGLSSMGAIRAYEMRHLGMVGYGKVYERFFHMEDFQDDELALLHEDGPPWRTVSEPLVHFRECVEHLAGSHQLTPDQGHQIIHHLKSLYFGERTLRLFRQLIQEYSGRSFEAMVPDFDRFRVKSRDLERFLEEEVWKKTPVYETRDRGGKGGFAINKKGNF